MKAYTYADRPAQYIVLCDSWYPKGVVCDLDKIPNISLICNVRVDTAIYGLPEMNSDEAPKRGRPRLIGEKIDIAAIPVIEVDNCDYSTVSSAKGAQQSGVCMGQDQTIRCEENGPCNRDLCKRN